MSMSLYEKTMTDLDTCSSKDKQCLDCILHGYDLECLMMTLKNAKKLLREYNAALKGMVYQYCTYQTARGEEILSHNYMSAGEEAFRLLGIHQGDTVPEGWLDE